MSQQFHFPIDTEPVQFCSSDIEINSRKKSFLVIPGYRILERIGEGTFGTVYRAKQSSTGQDVAVKLLRSNFQDNDSQKRRIARFLRETRLCAELRHPYIVQLIDQGTCEDDQLFAVFEYIKGETLQELLTRNGPLPASQLKTVMGQVLQALAYAHEKGIIHRDLKPGNIMVTTNNIHTYAKILDFGVGGFLPEAVVDRKDLTLPLEAIGTPSYAAPEQLRGEPLNAKSDLYSWGLVFLECLTGQPVMTGTTVAEIIHRQLLFEAISLPSAITSHPIAGLLRRVLAKRLQDRIGDAARVFSEYHKINLGDLVGKFTPGAINNCGTNTADQTAEGMMAGADLRRITVLCCNISILPRNESQPDFETIDSLHRTHNTLCVDIASRYGGYHAGSLGDFNMFYFGYPEYSDSDIRLAVRSALDLAEEVHRRSRLLEEQQNFRLELRAGIHSGPVHVERGAMPSGNTPNLALRLAAMASAGQVLLSDPIRDRQIHHLDTETVKNLSGFPSGMKIFSLIGEHRNEARSLFSNHPIVGRKDELDILQKGWFSAQNGKGKAFLIKGEAGIGKSSLAGNACCDFLKNGAVIMGACCFPEYRNSALHPVFEIVRCKIGITDNQDATTQSQRVKQALKECGCDVETVYPVFCIWLTLPILSCTLTPHSPQRQKEFLFDGLARLLFHLPNPVEVFIIEDLHWADPTTLEFLNLILQSLNNLPIMLIATARPEFDSPFRVEVLELIQLKELSDPESMELLDQSFGNKNISINLKRRILDRTGGLPFFIEMLAQTVLESPVANTDKQYEFQENAFFNEIPSSLMDLLSAQVHRLGQSRETAQLCSVIGREWEYGLLADVSLLDEKSLLSDLDELVKAGILIQKRVIHSSTYFFRHALLKDAAYLSITSTKKREYHERIARVLAEAFSSMTDKRAVMLAYHHAGAHQFQQAVHVGIGAATEFLNKASLFETIRLSLDVLDWIEKCETGEKSEAKLRINGILTQSLMGTQGWAAPEVKERIDLSRNLLDRVSESPHYVPTLCSLMTYHYVSSNRKELKCVSDELIHYANRSSDSGLQIAARTFSGLWAHGAGLYPEAEKLFEFVLEKYQPDLHGNHGALFGLDTRVWSAATLALVKWFTAKPEEAICCADEACEWAKAIQHIPSICIALLYKSNLCHYMNDRARAEDVVSELNALADTHSLSGYLAYGQIMAFWLSGKSDELEAVLSSLENMGCTAAHSYYRSLLANIYASHGQLDKAVECIETCLLLCKKNDELYYEPELYRLHAEYLLLRNPQDWVSAEASYIKAEESARKGGMVYIEKKVMSQLVERTKSR